MATELPKNYNPNETEQRIYQTWESSGLFNPDNLPNQSGEPFAVVQPPVNVTGVLHIGHAYENSLQDAVIRYQRMCGKKVLWVPGTDSAAIATQAKVEKIIQKEEGKSRHDLGREELVRRVSEFAKQSETTILNQVKRLGASLDWTRYAYTLDEPRNKAVATAFKRMYDAGLIYRGKRIVNWDPKGQTVISDDEIVYEERDAKLYTFRYSKDFPIPVATTRLETKVGDTAVAVHPDDPRYQQYIGQEFDVVFCDVPLHLKIVADTGVDQEFGTGALGVTPAHSQIDWEIADRNDLPRPQVINEYARMMVAGSLADKKVLEAREIVADWLRTNGLLEKEEDVKQNVSVAERTGGIIEPLPKLQWFIDVDKTFTIPHSEIPGIASGSETTLKHLMRTAVESGAVDMPQENFKKSYYHWINNLHDWCISRQIWFGHRIPIWYKAKNGIKIKNGDVGPLGIDDQLFERYCGLMPPAPIQTQENVIDDEHWTQDSDVLDTWFSSALWTFSTLRWPDATSDLKTFHPNAFMSPGYEILFLWISRMILMSGFHLGQVPFKTVLIHGLVRDKQGKKFSKSLGNGVDPIQMFDTYGADALRMALLVGTAIGNDIKFDEDKVRGYKHFANKVWNIARFVLLNLPDGAMPDHAPELTPTDATALAELNTLVTDVTQDMDQYRLYLAAEKIYHYIWHQFADVLIEAAKPALTGEDPAAKQSAQWTMYTILHTSLRLLHPFMPFVTEEIWSHLPTSDGQKKSLLMISAWPTP